MRVPRLISEFIEWRWAPCVGLTAGSLAFVALSLLFIPTQIESKPAPADSWRASGAALPSPRRALFGASLVQRPLDSAPTGLGSQTSADPDLAPNLERAKEAARQHSFSQVADRPPSTSAESAPPSEAPVVLQQAEPGGLARDVASP